jgi:hypothetical protein
MDLDLEIAAANVAVTKAHDDVEARRAAVAECDAEITAATAKLRALDALSSVTTAQMAEIENLRRKLRTLDADRKERAAALAQAQAHVDKVRKDLAALEFQRSTSRMNAARRRIGSTIVRLVSEVIEIQREHDRLADEVWSHARAAGIEVKPTDALRWRSPAAAGEGVKAWLADVSAEEARRLFPPDPPRPPTAAELARERIEMRRLEAQLAREAARERENARDREKLRRIAEINNRTFEAARLAAAPAEESDA